MKLLLLLGLLAYQEGPAKNFEWAKDLETAKAQSKKDGRLVALYFTFDT